MPRTAILLTLIVATYLGPLLCCCALGIACPTRGVASSEPETTACPHCQKNEPTGSDPVRSKHDCPVCEKRQTDTTYVEAKPAPLPTAPAFVAWLPLDAFAAARPSAAPTVGVLPRPDPRTYFLDSCHRLRC